MELVEGHRPLECPRGVPELDVDPYDPAILRAPEDFYAELRACGPFAYLPKYQMLACGRYDETQAVFSDWERFVSSRGVGLQDFTMEEPWRPPSKLLEADPPAHDPVRKVIVRSMAPKVVAGLRGPFAEAAEELVLPLIERGRCEAVTELAERYPSTVFPAAVGLKDNDPRRLITYGSMVFNGVGPDNEIRREAMAHAGDVVPWITAACERARLAPEGIGASLYEGADAGEISESDAGMLVRSLFSAGVDTTISGISSALWCLATHPEAFEALRADPSLARPCFEETLRLTSPVHSFCRTADVDTEVAGVSIEEGTKILCVLASANLDEDKWPSAATFDIHRRPVGHLAFGVGIHNCPGQNVARAEAEAVLTTIARHATSIALDGEPHWGVNNAVRALASLPLRFNA